MTLPASGGRSWRGPPVSSSVGYVSVKWPKPVSKRTSWPRKTDVEATHHGGLRRGCGADSCSCVLRGVHRVAQLLYDKAAVHAKRGSCVLGARSKRIDNFAYRDHHNRSYDLLHHSEQLSVCWPVNEREGC